jgi:hypothetical protein
MHQQCHEKKTKYRVSDLGIISRAKTENLEFYSNMEDFWSKCDEKFKGREKNERYIILSKENEHTEYVTNITHSVGRKIAYFTRFNLLNIVSDWRVGMIWNKLSRDGALFTIRNDKLFYFSNPNSEVRPEYEVMKIRVKKNDSEIEVTDEHHDGYHLHDGCFIQVEVNFEDTYFELFSFTYKFRELT